MLKERDVIKTILGMWRRSKISIEDVLDNLLVKKRKRNELNLTRDEQRGQQVTLNEVIKNIQRLAVHDFTTLVHLYMSTILLFFDSKCTVHWYIVE